MAKKTIKAAAETLKVIKSELISDVIKDYEIPRICNFDTGKETGFAVILLLSTKYDYPNDLLDDWKKRLKAKDYVIIVKRNQLRVKFNVMY